MVDAKVLYLLRYSIALRTRSHSPFRILDRLHICQFFSGFLPMTLSFIRKLRPVSY